MADLDVVLQIRAELGQAQREIADLRAEVARLAGPGNQAAASLTSAGAAADRAGDQAAQSSAQWQGLGGALGAAQKAVAAYLTFDLARRMVGQADAARVLESRVANLTKASGDFRAVWAGIYDISQENGTAVADTVQLFQRLSMSAERLGASNADVLAVVRAVQQLGRESGASSQELADATRQFGQMLGQVKPQAEELNSILEAMPALAQAIEQGLGLLPGELKRAAAEGRVLTADVFGTLLKQSAEIDARSKDTARSLGQSAQAVGNSIQTVVAGLDQAVAGTSTLGGAFDALSDKLDNVAARLAAATDPKELGVRPDLDPVSRFNALIERRIELTRRYGEIQAEVERVGALNPVAQRAQGLANLQAQLRATAQELGAVTAEIERTQNANVAAAKGAGDLKGGLAAIGPAAAAGSTEARNALASLREQVAGAQDDIDAMRRALAGQDADEVKAPGLADIAALADQAQAAIDAADLPAAIAKAKEGAAAIRAYMESMREMGLPSAGGGVVASMAMEFQQVVAAAAAAVKDAQDVVSAGMRAQEADLTVRPVLDEAAFAALRAQIAAASQTITVRIQTEIVGAGGAGADGMPINADGTPLIEREAAADGDIDAEAAGG